MPTIAYLYEGVMNIRCGCFKGTLPDFKTRVHAVYPKGHQHRIEYDDFISKLEVFSYGKTSV